MKFVNNSEFRGNTIFYDSSLYLGIDLSSYISRLSNKNILFYDPSCGQVKLYDLLNNGLIKDTSIGNTLYWNNGFIDVSNYISTSYEYFTINNATTLTVTLNNLSEIHTVTINGIEYYVSIHYTFDSNTKTITFLDYLPYDNNIGDTIVKVTGKSNATITTHDNMNGLNIGNYQHLTLLEKNRLRKFEVDLLPSMCEVLDSSTDALLVGTVGTYTSWSELLFDATTAQKARFTIGRATTNNYTDTSINIKLDWRATATTGNVLWGISLKSLVTSENIDTDYETQRTVLSAVNGTTNLTNTATLQFTPTAAELTAGNILKLQVYRVSTDSTDTMVGDAKLLNISVYEG